MPKHGGKREGAGSPPSGRTERVGPFMVSPESAEWLGEQPNKSVAVDNLIKKEKQTMSTIESTQKTIFDPYENKVVKRYMLEEGWRYSQNTHEPAKELLCILSKPCELMALNLEGDVIAEQSWDVYGSAYRHHQRYFGDALEAATGNRFGY